MSRARQVIEECKEFYARWGQLADKSLPYNASELLDAMIAVEEDQEQGEADHSRELTKVKRQLTAALAREAKQKKQIDRLQGALEDAGIRIP